MSVHDFCITRMCVTHASWCAWTSPDDITTIVCVNVVTAFATKDSVPASYVYDLVVASTSVDSVLAFTAFNVVISFAAIDKIISSITFDIVVSFVSINGVVSKSFLTVTINKVTNGFIIGAMNKVIALLTVGLDVALSLTVDLIISSTTINVVTPNRRSRISYHVIDS